jgi:hypothetical protein
MAMSKKDFEKAAAIVRQHRKEASASSQHYRGSGPSTWTKEQRADYDRALTIADAIEESFVMLFSNDNPNYDSYRFRKACRLD